MLSKSEKKTGGAGKAWASAFMPGLGQFLDGRTKEGATFMGASMGVTALSMLMNKSLLKAAFTHNPEEIMKILSKAPSKSKLIATVALSLASTGLWIANVVNAYKGKKAE